MKFYITTPIYYVNDKPHIGHAYTTIAADVIARFYRQKRYDVFFLTGTDEHGAKNAESAKAAGLKPQEFVDQMSELFRLTWKNLNIKYDDFIRTTDQFHVDAVNKFMARLKENGDIYEDKYEGLYCTGCEKFMTEKELVEGKCPDHKRKPKKIKEKNYFFRLTKYLDRVEERIISDQIRIRPAERKKEVLGLFKQGLKDFSVSREKVKWGIPLVFDEKQVIYVWVEALQNYISAIGYGADEKRFNYWWPANLHLMAKDILKFHAIYWPALLMAVGLETPKEQFIHGFFTIDGQKMSKTLGNVINPNELVDVYGSDATRYLILSQFPFGQDGDVKESLFTEKYNSDLANGLGNLVSRTSNLMEKFNVKTDDAIVRNDGIDTDNIEVSIKNYFFDAALKNIFGIVYKANKYLDENAPWKMGGDQSEKRQEVLQVTANWLKLIARYIYPFMPITSRRITKQFAGPLVSKSDSFFPRIDKL